MATSAEIAVATTEVATHLDKAVAVAKRLSLAAKNARVVVFRAGAQAAGLTVITSYFSDVADKTIQLVNQINTVSTQVAFAAIGQWRQQMLDEHLNRALVLAEGSPAQARIESTILNFSQANDTRADFVKTNFAKLDMQLEEIHSQMRAANLVVVSSRLEAIHTGDFQSSLELMADDIQQLAEDISGYVEDSRNILKRMN